LHGSTRLRQEIAREGQVTGNFHSVFRMRYSFDLCYCSGDLLIRSSDALSVDPVRGFATLEINAAFLRSFMVLTQERFGDDYAITETRALH